MLCKAFGCTPSQLEKEDAGEVEAMGIVFNEIASKNPLLMFM